MADDPRPLLALEPISGPAARGGASVLDPALEPELFAVAWFITAGHDDLAALVLGAVRDEVARSWHGATDARLYALTLLVPRARRVARGVRPAPSGVALVDDVFTASSGARAAIALTCGAGLDLATAGQVLGVHVHDCESLCRHARGAARFVGVPEAVVATFAAVAARVRRAGVPAPGRAPRSRRRATRVLGLGLLGALLVAGTVRATRRDGAGRPVVAAFAALDAPGWTFVSAGAYDTGSVAQRAYVRLGPDGRPVASIVLDDAAYATDEQTVWHDLPDGTRVGERASIDAWRKFVVRRVGCPPMAARAFGYDDDTLLAAFATLRCSSTPARLRAPSGAREVTVTAPPGLRTSRVRYSGPPRSPGAPDAAQIVLYAWPAYTSAEMLANPGARLVVRDGRRVVIDTTGVPTATWSTGDALLQLIGYGVAEDALVDLVAHVHPLDAAASATRAPGTTSGTVVAAPPPAFVIGPVPAGHRIVFASAPDDPMPVFATAGPGTTDGVVPTMIVGAQHRREPALAATATIDAGGRTIRLRTNGPGDDLTLEWQVGDATIRVDAVGVPEGALVDFAVGCTLTDDPSRWQAFVEARRAG